MRRRGITVLELMLVLVLLVAIGALAVPALQGRVSGMAFDEACATLEWASVRAREKAMREGRPIRLVARAVRLGGPVDVFAEPASAADLVGQARDGADGGFDAAGGPNGFDDMMLLPSTGDPGPLGLEGIGGVPDTDERPDAASDRLMRLPGGSRLALRWAFDEELGEGGDQREPSAAGEPDPLAAPVGAGRGGVASGDPFASRDEPEGPDPAEIRRAATALAEAPQLVEQVIAVFLPDGTIVRGGDAVVFVAPRRAATFVIDPWLRSVRVESMISPPSATPERGELGDTEAPSDRGGDRPPLPQDTERPATGEGGRG